MSSWKQYRTWNPDQPYLFPPDPHDWLREDDLAYFILDVVSALDLSVIERAIQGKDPRGTRPYHPRMMVAILLYGYCVGVMSSRKLEAATYRDVAFRVIAGGNHPDHTVISEFRREHSDAFHDLFVQTVRLAQKAGLVKLGRVGLDGTKVQANASKHKAMSYERMVKSEAELSAEIAEILGDAERTDEEEDARYGRGKRGDEIPEELSRRETRLARIQRAREELEAEAAEARAEVLRERAEKQRRHAETTDDEVEQKRARTRAAKWEEQAEKLSRDDDEEDPPASPGSSADDLPEHRVPTTPEGTPTDKAQRNFTDPDSRIMRRDGSYMQGYNCQAAVDDDHQIIIGCAATNQAADLRHFVPLVEQVFQNCGKYPDKLLADAGYWYEEHPDYCEDLGIDPYIATERFKHGQRIPPARGRPPKDLDAKGKMYRKLRTKKGREEYARRKVIPEPVFGQIRESQGFRRFLLRGKRKIGSEWALVCGCHNLLKIFRSSRPAFA